MNVQASGFKPGSSVEISIHSQIVKLETTTADGNGNINLDIVIPSTIAAGAHEIEAAGVDPSDAPLVLQQDLEVMALPETDLATGRGSGAPGGLLILLGLMLILAGLGGRRGLSQLRGLIDARH